MTSPAAPVVSLIKFPRSSRPANAKLTGRLAYWLRIEHRRTPARKLADLLGCSPSAVCRARRGATFRWAGGLSHVA